MYLFMYVTDEPVYISAMYLIAQAKCSVNPRIPGGDARGGLSQTREGRKEGGESCKVGMRGGKK